MEGSKKVLPQKKQIQPPIQKFLYSLFHLVSGGPGLLFELVRPRSLKSQVSYFLDITLKILAKKLILYSVFS